MNAFGRVNEESRKAGSAPAYCLTFVRLDSESLIARASFGSASPFFHIREIVFLFVTYVSICVNRRNLRMIISVISVFSGVKNSFAA